MFMTTVFVKEWLNIHETISMDEFRFLATVVLISEAVSAV